MDMREKQLQQPPCILTAAAIRQCEQYTMLHEPISSTDLMERAGTACAKHILATFPATHIPDIYIFCGPGNNGGDGLVIARQLLYASLQTCNIHVILCFEDNSRTTSDMRINQQRWDALVLSNQHAHSSIFDPHKPIEIPEEALIVDALFGIGLNKPVGGLYAEAIRAINASHAHTIAIDIPSGLYADHAVPAFDNIVMAQTTLTMQFPKEVFFHPEAYPFCGNVEIMDIGMRVPPDLSWDKEHISHDTAQMLFRPGNPYAHKGTFGHGLLIAGSADMPGAAILAATAALRGGIGKVTVHTAALATQTFPAALPEAILHRDINNHHVSNIQWDTLQTDIRTVAIGPGLGRDAQTGSVLKDIMDRIQSPLIIDADALNIIAENKAWLPFLPANSILTPHLKEFERLAGPSTDSFDRAEKAKTFAQRYNIILILKGHHTLISMPDGHQFYNTTGNEGMATAGSGDVLTGLLLALLAQDYSPAATAILGVYIHGLAGDLYAQDNHPASLIASDLPRYFGKAFFNIIQNKES
jgi:NAD(P)H-hydrate epimerase